MVDLIRMPAVAGTFYPNDPADLKSKINIYLDSPSHVNVENVKALIVPHAGYKYSGYVAASAYSILRQHSSKFHRVIIIGPAHRFKFNGVALCSADQFLTPLGGVKVEKELTRRLLTIPGVQTIDQAHEAEHSLEVHLPFLQQTLDEFSILPMVVGKAKIQTLRQIVDLLWDGPETLFIISTDLSHFHDYSTAVEIDEQTCQMIENLHWKNLEGHRACGYLGVSAILSAAKSRNLNIIRLNKQNSGDISGNLDKVVGYASFAIVENKNGELISIEDKKSLLRIAKQSLIEGVQNGKPCLVDLESFSTPLRKMGASFVTLQISGKLRGCTGTIAATQALAENVANSAYGAGNKDPRFKPLEANELEQLHIGVSILSPFQEMSFVDEADALNQMQPGKEGYLLSYEGKRGLFLPSVWKSITDQAVFLLHLKKKAGLAGNFWDNKIRLQRFTTKSFGAHFNEIL